MKMAKGNSLDKQRTEQSLVLIKPDALRNSLTGYVLSHLSEYHTGLRYAGAKIVHVSQMLAEEHYAEHRDKVFFSSLIDFIMGRIHYPDEPGGRRVIALVYQGHDATKKIRDIAGPTNPLVARDSKPGCIRSLGTLAPLKDSEGNVIGERMDNLIHASATVAEAEREIKLWFAPHDIPPGMRGYPTEVSQDYYYYERGGGLCTDREPGSICFLTPNALAWKSDLEVIQLLQQGMTADSTIESVVAKYLINYS